MDKKDRHHLFSNQEIRIRLMEIFGSPKTKEQLLFIGQETKRVHSLMPLYEIDRNLHESIHQRFQMWQRIIMLFRKYDPKVPIHTNPVTEAKLLVLKKQADNITEDAAV